MQETQKTQVRSLDWEDQSPGEGNGSPLQETWLENPMNRGAWQATVHGVARVEHDLATKPPPPIMQSWKTMKYSGICFIVS